MRQQWADYRTFWREFRQAYHTTGAVLPSGRALARALARFVRDGEAVRSWPMHPHQTLSQGARALARRILEVGPGTGAVTGQIVRDMRPEDRLTLVELNEQFVARLRERLAEDRAFESVRDRVTLVHASVEDLPEDEPYDLIVSGLPLNNFSVELVGQILAKMRRLMAARGTLSFFEYVAVRRAKVLVSPGQRKRLRGISRVFDEVVSKNEVKRDLVLANMPPAWVHHVRW